MASFNPNTTLGAYEIGVLTSYALFGVTTIQAYIYYGRFPHDSSKLKLLVAFVWSCEIAHAFCIGHTLYRMTVSDFAHPERLIIIPKSLATAVLFSGMIGATIQAFFASRIYGVSKSLYIPCLSWTLSFLRLLGSVAVCAYGFRAKTIPDFENRWTWLLNSLWSVAPANDLLIAARLVQCLYRQRPTGDNRTVALVDKLIAWTIETGVVTVTRQLSTAVIS
ncbi:hypothetical protein B0H17DRAFT_1202374 [Mycena rosella]|uniref:Uncharacterized protein n=1 Tax=Mycena rosella TaxID=1033263 RepID=A0AAD7DEW1_MYCRO|nr:hypothetical protein B0H17DRAFT_1202374 [Mycena rosella]